MDHHGYENSLVSLTKTKILLKKFCGSSYKKEVLVNYRKIPAENRKQREQFIKLFVQWTEKYNCRNLLSIDETAWYANQHMDKAWSIKGQESY